MAGMYKIINFRCVTYENCRFWIITYPELQLKKKKVL